MMSGLRPTSVPPPRLDVGLLREALERLPDVEVRCDVGTRALYATDASNYRLVPYGVVLPKTVEAIPSVVEVCRRHGAPITMRGGGTSLAGQTCNEAVIIDVSKYLRAILEINPEERYAVVEPGVVLDQLRAETNKVGLTFAPDPSTHAWNTLGGMMGNNSCGVHSVMGGRTSDNVLELEVVTYDGVRMTVGPTDDATYQRILAAGGRRADIYRRLKQIGTQYAEEIRARYPRILRRISGYNLPDLLPESDFNLASALVGTEGTCVVILRAKLRLIPNPPERVVVLLGYESAPAAADDVPRLLTFGPIGLEAVDEHLVRNMEVREVHLSEIQKLPEGKAYLFAEFGGRTKEEAKGLAEKLVRATPGKGGYDDFKIIEDREQQKKFWEVREAGLAVTAREPGGKRGWPGWEDSAVPPERMGDYLRELYPIMERHHVTAALYGHFGQGCLHARFTFDLESDPGIDEFYGFMKDAARLCVRMGGSLSGEHGDGQARAELLGLMYGDRLLAAFREFKAVWDPDGKMNPGKKVDPAGITEHLRLKETYHPLPVPTEFRYPDEHGDFNSVTLKCVGIGKCRALGRQVMCPSYQATREEKYTTRGRARLLYEMVHGAIPEGWKSETVRDSLEYCLSCKGCRGECPVNVDMATYKAEFLSHYYRGRLRPRHAYALGLSYRWLPLGAIAPGVVNRLTSSPRTAAWLKGLGGIAEPRPMPKLAPVPYRRLHQRHPPDNRGISMDRTVVLWTDTWNDFIHPPILSAAEAALHAFGYRVEIPGRRLCCGRPLYDFGMLGRAKGLLRKTLRTLAGSIDHGYPVIVLEPSCLSVFRDEMPELLPGEPRAAKLAHLATSLEEFVVGQGIPLPRFPGRAWVHPHCHQAASKGQKEALGKLFERLGMDAEINREGCCGMAGSFGLEREKYDVSVQIAKRNLLPQAQGLGPDTYVIADGFSCGMQLEGLAHRTRMHVAQLLSRAVDAGATVSA
jgi:FAD/FMN-containing dehydrogenase/Fe-S oxidoreductase